MRLNDLILFLNVYREQCSSDEMNHKILSISMKLCYNYNNDCMITIELEKEDGAVESKKHLVKGVERDGF